MSTDKGLWGHHPDCPHSVLADTIVARTSMSECRTCEAAEKADHRGYLRAVSDFRNHRGAAVFAFNQVWNEAVKETREAVAGVVFRDIDRDAALAAIDKVVKP